MNLSFVVFNAITASLVSLGLVQLADHALPSASPSPPAITPSSELTTSPQRLQLTLTLSTPEDLKVREGDRVTVGQILSDRVRERQRLAAQQTQLHLQMERLNQPIPGPPPVQPIPEVAGLPPASFLDEVAAVEQAKLKVEQAER
ncbi:MAG TPA: hypothetical protein V6C65_29810, partial [Allocoleopsis sp.]